VDTPKLSAWAQTCYGTPSHLYFKDYMLLSCAGAHQGDPLTSLIFYLALQPIIKHIREECLFFNVWFLDNGTIVGTCKDLLKVLQLLKAHGSPHGLILNHAKSLVWCGGEDNPSDDPLGCGIPPAGPNGLIILGAPVGDATFTCETVEERINKISALVDLLLSLNNAQAEFCLLRSCLSLPKFA
jgi:hypothetical protein